MLRWDPEVLFCFLGAIEKEPLFPSGGDAFDRTVRAADERQSGRKVVNETYDEMVFWEPTEEFYSRIKSHRAKGTVEPPDIGLPVYNEQAELNNLLSSRHKIAEEKAKIFSRVR
jgi:hypothetical protein